MFIFLIVGMVSRVYTHAKIYQIVPFMRSPLRVNYTSIKIVKIKNKQKSWL